MFRITLIDSSTMRLSLKGFSLIEILIVLALSSSVLLSAFYMLQHTSSLYHHQQQRLHAVATERYAQYLLSKSIRLAGFLPCGSLNQQSTDLVAISTITPPSWLTTPIPNSQVLKIDYANPKVSYLTQAMHSPQSELHMSPKLTIPKNQWLVISDCQQLAFFSRAQPLQQAFPKHSMLSYLETQWFYLRSSTDGSGTALFMRNQTGESEELIDGVTQFRSLFSIDGQHFVTSNDVNSWRNAKAVEIQIHYQHDLTQDFIVRLRNQ